MIQSFADDETADIYHGKNSKNARKRLDPSLWNTARKKLDMIKAANRLEDLKIPPGNHLEALTKDLRGKYSIRINKQWRIVFSWTGGDASDVKIQDYH